MHASEDDPRRSVQVCTTEPPRSAIHPLPTMAAVTTVSAWRFLDAGRPSAPRAHHCRRPKTCTNYEEGLPVRDLRLALYSGNYRGGRQCSRRRGRGNAAGSNPAVPLTRAPRPGPCRAIPVSASACDRHRCKDACRRVVWGGRRACEGSGSGVRPGGDIKRQTRSTAGSSASWPS
jgi:hypothetical protein